MNEIRPHPHPRISVVTPSFNQAEFLEATLDSVLSQGYPNLEYIVMDGGSTDGSADIIRRYEKHLTYWQSQRDGGQSMAINSAFERATGDIYCWINSDDQLLPGSLARVAALLPDKSAAAWIVGPSVIINTDGSSGLRQVGAVNPSVFLNWVEMWFPQQSTFWTKKLWWQVGALNPALHYAMDLDLWIRMWGVCNPRLTHQPLALYRHHVLAKSVSMPTRVAAEVISVIQAHGYGAALTLDCERRQQWRRALTVQSRINGTYKQYIRAAKHAWRAAVLATPSGPARGAQPHQKNFVITNSWDGISGVNVWGNQLADGLLSKGCEVGFISGEHRPTSSQGARHLKLLPMTWHWGNATTPRYINSITSLLRSVRPCTVLPNYSIQTYAACAMLKKSRPNELRVLGVAHSDDPFYYDLLSAFEPAIDVFVAVSDEIREKLVQMFPHRADDCFSKPYSIAVGPYPGRMAEAAELRLVYVGRVIEEQKRVGRLVSLCHRLHALAVPVTLTVVGDGPDLVALRQQAAALLPPGVIRFEGRVPHDRVPELLRNSDIFVMTSAYEGTSLAMLEAMAHGCVPVVTRVSGVAAMIKDGVHGYSCDPDDLDAMADVISRLHADRTQLARLSRDAHAHVKTNCSDEQYLSWLLDLDRRLWSRPPSAWPARRPIPYRLSALAIFLKKLKARQFGVRSKLKSVLGLRS